MSSILVGLDLSPSSGAASQRVAQQARLTGRGLLAIGAVPIPASLASVGIIGMPRVGHRGKQYRHPHREAVSAVWHSLRPGLGWTLEFVLDDPGRALVARSAETALLAVGNHEHVGLSRLVSSSVSRYCLSRAKCPTVIVPVDNRAVSSAQLEQPTRGCETEVLPMSLRTSQAWANNETWKPSCD
jgi:nucleotide-binding universal stress UspA family protein